MQPAPPKVPPVAADMETVCTQGNATTTTQSKFFRDEMSRTRVEHGDIASISDPVKGQSFVLNMPQKIAMPSQPSMPGLPAMPGMPAMPAKPNVALPQIQPPQMQETKDLGQKVINGIKVHGKQYSLPAPPSMPAAPAMPSAPGMPAKPAMPGMPAPPSMPAMPQPPTAEVWSSPDLKLPIQSSMTNPATGTNCVTQMKNVQPGVKLPESMFQVPPGFKVPAPQPPSLAGKKLI